VTLPPISPSAVHNKPTIHNSRTTAGTKDQEGKDHLVKCLFCNSIKEDRGNILIRGLWSHDTDCIIDVHMTDVYAKSNRSKAPEKVLAAHKQEKKRKHLETCLEQR
jgi:hypothetical protein